MRRPLLFLQRRERQLDDGGLASPALQPETEGQALDPVVEIGPVDKVDGHQSILFEVRICSIVAFIVYNQRAQASDDASLRADRRGG